MVKGKKKGDKVREAYLEKKKLDREQQQQQQQQVQEQQKEDPEQGEEEQEQGEGEQEQAQLAGGTEKRHIGTFFLIICN